MIGVGIGIPMNDSGPGGEGDDMFYKTLNITTNNTVPYDVPNDGNYIIIVTTDGSGDEQVVNLTYPDPLPNSGAYPQNYSVIVLMEDQVDPGDIIRITVDGANNGFNYIKNADLNRTNGGDGSMACCYNYSGLTLEYNGAGAKFNLRLYTWALDNNWDEADKNVVWSNTDYENYVLGNSQGIVIQTLDGIAAGAVTIKGGSPTSDDNNGGNIVIQGGNPAGSGNGGSVTITSGTADNADGATVTFTGAQPNQGGSFLLTGGDGDGTGGDVNLEAGTSGTENGSSINIHGAIAATHGGGIDIIGGSSPTYDGGSVSVNAGNGGAGAGTGGTVQISIGTGDTNGEWQTVNVPAADPGNPGQVYFDNITGQLKVSL